MKREMSSMEESEDGGLGVEGAMVVIMQGRGGGELSRHVRRVRHCNEETRTRQPGSGVTLGGDSSCDEEGSQYCCSR